MLNSLPFWSLATRFPRAFSGATLHGWALEAMYEGHGDLADRLFEAAASRYRVELAVEPLARLRAHQLIARVRSLDNPEREAEMMLEVERVLTRLNRIEALEPPFELVEARTLLATWLNGAKSEDAYPETPAIQRAA